MSAKVYLKWSMEVSYDEKEDEYVLKICAETKTKSGCREIRLEITGAPPEKVLSIWQNNVDQGFELMLETMQQLVIQLLSMTAASQKAIEKTAM